MKNSFVNPTACVSLLMTSVFLCSAPAAGFLHTQGENIVDEQGRKIMLRGVGLGNWMLPEGYMWRFGKEGDRPRKIEKIVSDLIGPKNAAKFWKEYRAQYITQKDIQRIAQLGFNSVRPSLNARLFLSEGENPVYQDEGFKLLDNLIRWCKRSGIYVIIDMHAAPGGQTGQNIDDSIVFRLLFCFSPPLESSPFRRSRFCGHERPTSPRRTSRFNSPSSSIIAITFETTASTASTATKRSRHIQIRRRATHECLYELS